MLCSVGCFASAFRTSFMKSRTKEPQYEYCLEVAAKNSIASLGLMTNQVWQDDPRRLGFVLARYKFVSKMFSGMDRVLEIGCADAFGTRIVLQEVNEIIAADFDPVFIEDARSRMHPSWKFDCKVHDMLKAPLVENFDGIFALDVIEHIKPAHENKFIKNMARSLQTHGVCIIGSPSIQSQAYASPASKAGHVNCKDAPSLKALMSKFFHNVFIFSMNDEVVHTGFYPMAHYLIAVCCCKK